MTQWGRCCCQVLSFIPGTNIVEEENQLWQVVFRLPYGCHGVSARAHECTECNFCKQLFLDHEMAHQVKAVNTKPEDLSSVPEIHMGKERTQSCKLPTNLHTCTVAYMCTHAQAKTE